MEEHVIGRLVFKPDSSEPDTFWAIDESNVEYCVYSDARWGGNSDVWHAIMQKRVAFESVSHGLGSYYDFDEACQACSDANPEYLAFR